MSNKSASLQDRMSIFFVLALLLHVLVVSVMYFLGPNFAEMPSSEADDVVVTQLVSPEEFLQHIQRTKVVETEEAQEPVEDSSGPIYQGERRQRVRKQTVTQQTGSIKGGPQILKPDPLNLRAQLAQTKPLSPEKGPKTGIVQRSGETPVTPRQAPAALAYGSMDGLNVDAEFGPLTQLNTDEYRFAGFFNRYRRSLYGIWQPTVWKYSTREQLVTDIAYLTKLVMHYSVDGELKKIEIQSSSGKQALDDAAVDSVKRLGLVQNIPKELYSADNTALVPITFSFQLIRNQVDFRVGSSPARRHMFR